MCGIAGFVEYHDCRVNPRLDLMIQSLKNRGPDDAGEYVESRESYTVGIGHTRLSIIDLSEAGHQPMRFKHLSMVYNGEVYNYLEIRGELCQLGHRFVSESDTEVVLRAFYEWGSAAVHKFNGMFAIALYDGLSNSLRLFRDRAGVKPLFFLNHGNVVLFGSTLNSLRSSGAANFTISPSSIYDYLTHGYIRSPSTIFKEVQKVLPGSYVEIDLQSRSAREVRYWNITDFYCQERLVITEDDALEQFHELLLSACKLRLIADVPVGVFLSGGYDSSTVTALLARENLGKRLQTFTIGFEDRKSDEAGRARLIAKHLGTEHHEYYCDSLDARRVIEDLPLIWDEPLADISCIPTAILCEFARKDAKVCLSADGGDEMLGGYEKYKKILFVEKYFKDGPLSKTARLAGEALLAPSASMGMFRLNERLRSFNKLLCLNTTEKRAVYSESLFSREEIERLFPGMTLDAATCEIAAGPKFHSKLDILTHHDFHHLQLESILPKMDRASMHFGLEVREPLLDYRLLSFSAQLPEKLKINKGVSKYLLKKTNARYLPTQLMMPTKSGFSPPIEEWLRTSLKDIVFESINSNLAKKVVSPDVKEISNYVEGFFRGEHGSARKVWALVVLMIWLDNFGRSERKPTFGGDG